MLLFEANKPLNITPDQII